MRNYLLCVVGLVLSANVNSAFIDRGNGLIYDDDLDVTWLSGANYAKTSGYDLDGKMTWTRSMKWAAQLEFGGFADWRLPIMLRNPCGYCIDNEMGHIYYTELERHPLSSPALDKFTNFQNATYWLGTEIGADAARIFRFNTGSQDGNGKQVENFAWAVHDGDIGAVPIPATVWLFGSGLISLSVYARRKS